MSLKNVTEAEVKRRKQLEYEVRRSRQPNKELEGFLERLSPYVSLQMDEPQFQRKTSRRRLVYWQART